MLVRSSVRLRRDVNYLFVTEPCSCAANFTGSVFLNVLQTRRNGGVAPVVRARGKASKMRCVARCIVRVFSRLIIGGLLMRIEGKSGLALLHDLAILYLGLAQGTDDDLDPSETKEVAACLRRWQPNKDPALIDHVIRDVSLSYQEEATTEEVRKAVQSLGEALSEERRREIMGDLAEIARADGMVLQEEKDFVEQIAETWEVSQDASLDSDASAAA
ncbi:MAG: hypothetical protein BRD46_02640 [Bacteroidetes bacterium QS_8_68_15]|nr:MAG: hypothetical protein BRD46_02640 [Bacteroidetes bacterium QS_8_68_15]